MLREHEGTSEAGSSLLFLMDLSIGHAWTDARELDEFYDLIVVARIAIANSDAAWHAYVDGALDSAYRTVADLLG